MASGLLLLLDDIASILDDVATLTQVAAKKTAGVLGDDLALNAQQVSGVSANRELPVLWAVAKGSLVNKAILVPSALGLSAAAPWAIRPLLIVGGLYLCYEGCEKLAHKYLHSREDTKHHEALRQALSSGDVDLVQLEKQKVKGAIRTDFVLSAEIVVISLGTVADSRFLIQLGVLVAISLLMTVGVYGLVAGIVKLDDLGARLIAGAGDRQPAALRKRLGGMLLRTAPFLMKGLSIAGTVAMFLVGGGIFAHGVPPVHHALDTALEYTLGETSTTLGRTMAAITRMTLEGLLGLGLGAAILAGFTAVSRLRRKSV